MGDVVIWHNPRCSKSRQTLALLQDKGIEPTIVRYLDEPPSQAAIADTVRKLGIPASALVRTGEALFRDLGLDGRNDLEDADWIAHLASHPRLIQRPVVIAGERAAIGRPPEAVLDIL